MDLDSSPVEPASEMQLDNDQDLWPFNRWADVEVIGSPKLTGLFENLKIGVPDIPDDIEEQVWRPCNAVTVLEQYMTASELAVDRYAGNTQLSLLDLLDKVARSQSASHLGRW